MYREAILAVCVLVTLSNEARAVSDDRNVTAHSQNNAKFESFALSALAMFQRFSVNKILLRACSTTETHLWWSKFNANKSESRMISFEENGDFYDAVLLDLRCESGLETMRIIINRNKGPVSFPLMITASSNNSELNRILKTFSLEGKFLADGLAAAKPPTPEFPSVLRVAIPGEKMLVDPAGAIIASKLITHLRDYLKLTLSFRRGNLSDVLSGNADLVADAVSMDEKFMDSVVSLGRQIWRMRTLVMIKTPGSLWDTDALVIPFSAEVWQAVGGSIMATALVLHTVAFWESRDVGAHPKSREENTWSFSVMTAMGMMCAQGFTSTTKWSAGRITLVVFEVFSLFIGLFYSSAMVTFLLTLPQTKIKTARDLVNWPLSIGVDSSYYELHDLVQSPDSIVRTTMSLKGEPMSIWDALTVASDQPIAFLSGEHSAVSAAGVSLEVSTICRLAPVLLRPDWPLALIGSKSAFTPWLLEQFRRSIAHIAEVGMLSGDTSRAAARPLICLQNDVTDTEAIGFRAIWPAVEMLGIGHLLAVTILVLEISVDAWHRYRPLHSKSA